MRSRTCWLALFLGLVVHGSARAELIAFEITKREPFAAGQSFGDVGPYEQITGIARFAIDPKDAHNRIIVDLDLAPRNKDGKVEFAADVVILSPKDLTKGNGAILYDVNNRGNKLALGMFNRAPGGPAVDVNNPAGDGFLMRRGFTVVWSGWIGELLPGNGRLLLQAPQVREDGKLLCGIVRYETSTDIALRSLPLSRREGHGSYPPTKEGETQGILTKRLHEADKREIVPRDQWKLVRMSIPYVKDGVPGTLPQVRLEVKGNAQPGYLYELICEAEGSIVQGVGFAGVRDLISFLRHDATAGNPLRRGKGKPAIDRALAFGVSQSGRFLRHFLYLGFDEDEQGRIVFEGLMPHVSGAGLGFFNHRFAQPTRHNAQHDEHLYPTDVFPFTYGPSTDPFTKQTDSILGGYADGKIHPKVIHTQTAAEYWHRSGSLVHTTPDGKADAEIPANLRIYAFGGCQHGAGDGRIARYTMRLQLDPEKMKARNVTVMDILNVVTGAAQEGDRGSVWAGREKSEYFAEAYGRFGDPELLGNVAVRLGKQQVGILRDVANLARVPDTHSERENPTNPADYRPFLRALLVALDDWVRDGNAPPESVFPRIGDGTLVDWHQNGTAFPKLPAIRYPQGIQKPPFADYGPKFASHGVITIEPPTVKGNYTVLVPKANQDGNDLGTLNLADITVPLATYTGWNLQRERFGADGALATLLGSCIPLPPTKADKARSEDPRSSIEERYATYGAYRVEYRVACAQLQRLGFLLPGDIGLLLKNLETRRQYFPAAEGK